VNFRTLKIRDLVSFNLQKPMDQLNGRMERCEISRKGAKKTQSTLREEKIGRMEYIGNSINHQINKS
jgi:hypothetical protein